MIDKSEFPVLLFISASRALYVGCLDTVEKHEHGAPCIVLGLDRDFLITDIHSKPLIRCDAVLIPPGFSHRVEFYGGMAAVIYLEPEGLDVYRYRQQLAECTADNVLALSADKSLLPKIRGLLNPTCDAFAIDAILGEIICSTGCSTSTSLLDLRIRKSIDLARKFFFQGMKQQTLAEHVHLSPSRFLHLFKQEVQVPFRRFLLWKKLRLAGFYMEAGASMTEAAIAAGFADHAHFSHAFRQAFGMTPSAVFVPADRLRIVCMKDQDSFGRGG